MAVLLKKPMRLVIIPTRWESQAVLQSLPGAQPQPTWDVPAWRTGDITLVEPGIGPRLTEALLPHMASLMPREVWLFGWCGGLTSTLRTGDLVLADATILSPGQDETARQITHVPAEAYVAQIRQLAHQLRRGLTIGPVLTSHRILVSAAHKQAAAASGAVAVEMEAGPLARWAGTRGVPFVHLRVVLDPLESSLPPTRLPVERHRRNARYALIRHVLSHPREWSLLWRFMWQAHTARRTMAQVIATLTESGGLLAPELVEKR